MSAYSEVKTEFKDGDLLLEALKAMGFQPRNCIGTPANLEGYHGDQRTQVADIIIPRAQVGNASNDIGFVKGPDGTFRAIISDFDSTRHNKKWLNEVKTNVADAGIQKQAKRMGLRLGSRKVVKGQIQYEFLRG